MTSDLAAQLVSHEAWGMPGLGWAPGMITADGCEVVVHDGYDVSELLQFDGERATYIRHTFDRPDIEADSTKGVLLGQCRRMAARCHVHPLHVEMTSDGNWGVYAQALHPIGDAPTEGEAIAKCWIHLADLYVAKLAKERPRHSCDRYDPDPATGECLRCDFTGGGGHV